MLSFKQYLKEVATNISKALPPRDPPSTSFNDSLERRVYPDVGNGPPRIPKGVETNEPPQTGVTLDSIIKKNYDDAKKVFNTPERVKPKIKSPTSRGFRDRVLDKQIPRDFTSKGFKDRVREKEPVIEAKTTGYRLHTDFGGE